MFYFKITTICSGTRHIIYFYWKVISKFGFQYIHSQYTLYILRIWHWFLFLLWKSFWGVVMSSTSPQGRAVTCVYPYALNIRVNNIYSFSQKSILHNDPCQAFVCQGTYTYIFLYLEMGIVLMVCILTRFRKSLTQ